MAQKPEQPVGTLSGPELAAIVAAAYTAPPRRGLLGRVSDAMRGAYEGFFGPGVPPTVTAPEGTPSRQFQFPVSVNRQFIPRGTEPIGFPELRLTAEMCTIFRSVIETVKNEEQRFRWELVPTEDSQRKDNDAQLNELQAFFKKPDGRHSFAQWLRALREDSMVIDAPTILGERTKKGEIFSLSYIDGATVVPKVDMTGRAPRDPDMPAYQQVIYGVPLAEFTGRQLVYMPRNPRPNRLYGFSEVEQGLITANVAINRELTQLLFYGEGNIPAAFIKAPPDWTPDQIKEAQGYWAQYRGDLAFRSGLVVVPNAGIQEMRPAPMKDEFDEWLARMFCSICNTSPLPFIKAGLNRATAQTAADQSIDQGIVPRQMYWSDFIGMCLFTFWGVTDIELKWQEVRDPDPNVQSEIWDRNIRNGSATINEARLARGEEPYPPEIGDQPMIVLATGPILLSDAVKPKPEADPALAAGDPTAAANGNAPPGNGGPPKAPAKPGEQTPAETMAAAAGGTPRRRRTVQTIPKRQRNFWQAERAPLPPRARPSS